jgi:hypothetical protein
MNQELACRSDVYMTTHKIYKRQKSMLPARLELAVPISERQQTYSLGRSVLKIKIKP